ncbi:MAG: GNAT family N-acetyltransferase [Lachnospiraceae bacterium]|nr:GNAT family N-acetyltransferase [Lachnospiraceae bacterium]
MVDTSIEYHSIIMRCDCIQHDAFRELPENVIIEYYKDGMEEIWKDIQKEAGEFSTKTDQETIDYFIDRFGDHKESLKEHCLFLKNKNTQQYIGTCMAWQSYKSAMSIPILHWLAVSDTFAGQGFARILITLILQLFENQNPNEPIYLHTQPSSYQAIKLYHDFGFQLCRTDTYGTAINEYEQAIKVLKQVMTKESYENLIKDSIL